jgi:hypothetical protein
MDLIKQENNILLKGIENQDIEELKYAKQLLENPGIAIKITDKIGWPIEKGMEMLPGDWKVQIHKATEKALLKVMDAALTTINMRINFEKPQNFWHTLSVGATGAAGGFFGLPALVIELPLTTAIMLRSIIDIARSQGETLESYESRLACLEVFALGGNSKSDDSAESGYYIVRNAMAYEVRKASEYLAGKVAKKGIEHKAAPELVKLIQRIALYFNRQVSEEVMAKMIPGLGAVFGAGINMLFINHFQDMATGHFIVRKLERKYGAEQISKAYMSFK